jgi:alkylation response protein AidB-like acyl-CoA dehydrogenase
VTIDLAYRAEARELAAAVRRLCATPADPPGVPQHWPALAEMGVLGLTAPGSGDAEVLAATMIELGAAGIHGPFLAVMVAARLLDSELADQVAAGRAIPAVGRAPLIAWAPVADVIIGLDGDAAYLASLDEPIEVIDTLAGEPWARCTLTRQSQLAGWPAAAPRVQVGAAAFLLGAGQRLLEAAVTYAGQRTQFGKVIGEFQATSHPLASSHLQLAAADALVRIAAHAVDSDAGDQAARAAAALASASVAAIETSYRAHQTLGAMGFTVEGPIGRRSQLIRQTAASAAALTDLTTAVLVPYDL